MIPNLAIVIGVYVVIRLGNMAAQQSARLRDNDIRKAVTIIACVVGAVLAVLCTLDTVGVGASIGSTIDARRPRVYP